MDVAIAGVIAEVFSGLTAAAALMAVAAQFIRATGDEPDAVQAEIRAAECAGILAIPWPFIYIGSNAWIAAVRQLRDSLPQFIDLEPADAVRRRAARAQDHEARTAGARARWDALSESARAELTRAGLDLGKLASLG